METRPLEGLYDVYLQAEGEYRLTVFLEKNGPFGRIPPPFPYIDRNCGGHDNCGMDSRTLQPAVDTVLRYFPDTEALYLFGSHEEEEERPGSDIDIAVLLPAHLAADANAVLTFDLQPELSDALDKPVDCVNLRRVSVVFRKEIIFTGQRFFTGNTYAAEEFEMLTLSYYQKLNDERKAILEELFRTKRSYAL